MRVFFRAHEMHARGGKNGDTAGRIFYDASSSLKNKCLIIDFFLAFMRAILYALCDVFYKNN